MDRLSREVRDGLRHGFFELTVACEIVKGGKRGLTIKAGKNHRFTIPEEEIEGELAEGEEAPEGVDEDAEDGDGDDDDDDDDA